MATAGLIETIEGVSKAYQDADTFMVPKTITANLTKREINAISCGVECALASIALVAKGETVGTDPSTLANAILCTAFEAYMIGELA